MVVLNTAGVHSHSVQVVQTPVFEERLQSKQQRTSSIQLPSSSTNPNPDTAQSNYQAVPPIQSIDASGFKQTRLTNMAQPMSMNSLPSIESFPQNMSADGPAWARLRLEPMTGTDPQELAWYTHLTAAARTNNLVPTPQPLMNRASFQDEFQTQTQLNLAPNFYPLAPTSFNVNPTVYPSVPPVPQYVYDALQQAVPTAYPSDQNLFGSPELEADLKEFITTGFLGMPSSKPRFSTSASSLYTGQHPDIDPASFLRQQFPPVHHIRAPTLHNSSWGGN